MNENPNPQEELLQEARRTTHAVRAIARFVLLIVSYQVFAAIAVGVGVGLEVAAGDGKAFGFILIGSLISITGLVHALIAGHNELDLSDRKVSVREGNPATREPGLERDERRLLPGRCSCTKWERGLGGTAIKENVEYCLRCERVVSQ